MRTEAHQALLDERRDLRKAAKAGNTSGNARIAELTESIRAARKAAKTNVANPERKRPAAKPARERKSPPKQGDAPRARKSPPMQEPTVHTDADIEKPPIAKPAAPVADTRPQAVIAAETAWRDTTHSITGVAMHGTAYTLLAFQKFELARLEAEIVACGERIKALTLQVRADPSASGVNV